MNSESGHSYLSNMYARYWNSYWVTLSDSKNRYTLPSDSTSWLSAHSPINLNRLSCGASQFGPNYSFCPGRDPMPLYQTTSPDQLDINLGLLRSMQTHSVGLHQPQEAGDSNQAIINLPSAGGAPDRDDQLINEYVVSSFPLTYTYWSHHATHRNIYPDIYVPDVSCHKELWSWNWYGLSSHGLLCLAWTCG